MQKDAFIGYRMKERASDKSTAVRSASLALTACLLLSGCSASFDRDYRLRIWERLRLASDFAYRKREWKMAVSRAKESVAEAEHLGLNDFRLGVSYYVLGKALRAQHKAPEAEASFKRAVEVFDRADVGANQLEHKLNQQEIGRALVSLGQIQIAQGKLDDAKESFLRAVKVYGEQCKVKDDAVEDSLIGHQFIRSLCLLAEVYLKEDNKKDAEACYQQALDMVRVCDYSDILAAPIRDALGELLRSQGRDQDAQRIYADRVWMRHVCEGQDALHNKDWPGAEKALQASFLEATRTGNTARIVKSIELLAEVYLVQGKLAEVEHVLKRAVRQYEVNPDKNADDIDNVYGMLSNLLINQGRSQEAQQYLRAWYDYRLSMYGPQSLPVAEVLMSTATSRNLLGQHAEAQQLAVSAFNILYPKYVSSKKGAMLAQQTGVALDISGQFDKAMILFKCALEHNLKRRGLDHVATIASRLSVASCAVHLHDEKDYQEQVREFKKVIARAKTDSEQVVLLPYIFQAVLFSCDGHKDDDAQLFYKIFKALAARHTTAAAGFNQVQLQMMNERIILLEQRIGHKV